MPDERAEHVKVNKSVKVMTASSAIGKSPIYGLCRGGQLPANARSGLDVDWSDVGFCSVSQMAALAAIQKAGTGAHVRQRYALPLSDACSYMLRMDYCKVLGIEREESFSRHDPADRFVPLTAIPVDEMSADPGGTADKLTRVVSSNAGFNGSTSDTLGLAFCEMIDNIVQHSEAESPGIAGAQWFPRYGYVETCVADCGVGIPASMRSNEGYSGKSDIELLEMAFEWETGQWFGKSNFGTREVSGGMGLSYSANLARSLGGHLWAVSHSSALHISSAGVERVDGLFYPGTLISMRLPKSDREVLESDVLPNGRDVPIRYEPGEGLYTEDDGGLLW